MRVVAGLARGRRIQAPPGDKTRPTTDAVREAVFNMLVSLGAVEGATVADLFAGSGAMGIEALSRGAAAVTFVESDSRAVATIRSNLEKVGLPGGSVVKGDAIRWACDAPPLDLVLADPPYGFERWRDLLEGIRADLVVLESGTEPILPEGWRQVRQKRHGTTVVTIAEPKGAA